MTKETATIHLRVDRDIKNKFHALCSRRGVSMTRMLAKMMKEVVDDYRKEEGRKER